MTMPPRRSAPVAFTQPPLFEMPTVEVQQVDPTMVGEAPLTGAQVEVVPVPTDPVEEPEQRTIYDAIADEEHAQQQPTRAVLGSRAKKWVPLAERTATDALEVSLPVVPLRDRLLAEGDALAIRSIRAERARQAAGRNHRLNNGRGR